MNSITSMKLSGKLLKCVEKGFLLLLVWGFLIFAPKQKCSERRSMWGRTLTYILNFRLASYLFFFLLWGNVKSTGLLDNV